MTSIKEMLTEERAVSPVVGVALLIAIAVILAAVVGAVVLGLGTSSAEAPQASLAFEFDGTEDVTIIHDGGETLDDDNVVLRSSGGAGEVESPFDESLSAGERAVVSNTGFDDGDEVSIVWQDPESDGETVIGSTTL